MNLNSPNWRPIDLFEKISLKQMRVTVVEGGYLVFAVKLKGKRADVACDKLHRKCSSILKDGFNFNEDTDILTYQPAKESLPIQLCDVQKAFEELVK